MSICTQFTMYEICKRHIFGPGSAFGERGSTTPDNYDKINLGGWRALVSGGISGLVCWFFGYPADLIKTRIQYAKKGFYPAYGIDEGFCYLAKQIYREEGALGFYRGFSAVSGRAVLSNGVGFYIWELARNHIKLGDF